ncbi:VOC family protein [Neobacillus sp. D3-1R]|uniref:VOC family protein n=1 Tax=Neobacillus sp. D3-1R TaxID=3445778 RepID=UPI003F9ED13C
MVPQRVSLVTLGAKNIKELRMFYQKLGWEEGFHSSEGYAVFKTAGVLLSLFPLEELIKDMGVEAGNLQEGFKGWTLAVNVNEPAEVDSAIETARAAGAQILREPSDAFWGGRTAYFSDPENNVWEIAWNPTATFDERGAMISF